MPILSCAKHPSRRMTSVQGWDAKALPSARLRTSNKEKGCERCFTERTEWTLGDHPSCSRERP
ncbi:hypothetical protein I7I48_05464 [Histoplasma ohiense]|nr:hypothetical protein I7I48_05464 [Histoplasma ohiense (nom. inval.)]